MVDLLGFALSQVTQQFLKSRIVNFIWGSSEISEEIRIVSCEISGAITRENFKLEENKVNIPFAGQLVIGAIPFILINGRGFVREGRGFWPMIFFSAIVCAIAWMVYYFSTEASLAIVVGLALGWIVALIRAFTIAAALRRQQ